MLAQLTIRNPGGDVRTVETESWFLVDKGVVRCADWSDLTCDCVLSDLFYDMDELGENFGHGLDFRLLKVVVDGKEIEIPDWYFDELPR